MYKHIFQQIFRLVFPLVACLSACQGDSTKPAVPDFTGKITDHAVVSDLNSWTEGAFFCVSGIINNTSPDWQKMRVLLEIKDAAGQTLPVKNAARTPVLALSPAIPPMGRSAFYWRCPLADIAGTPDTCLAPAIEAQERPLGPLMIMTHVNAVKTLDVDPAKPEAGATVEKSWLVTAVLNNPMFDNVAHPRVEILLYGTDGKLWFCEALNPEAPGSPLQMDKPSPIRGTEKRQVGCQIVYDMLPQPLRAAKIGRVEMLAFEER